MMKHYSLVKFLEEDGDDLIEIVLTKWLVGKDKAYWPPKKGSRDKITRWVMSLIDPDTSWEQFPIVLKHQYLTYNNARKALVKAEEETNIDSNVSDCEVPRKKKRPIRFESDDSDNDVPPKRCQTMAVSDSEDDLNQENAKSVLRNKVQSILKNVSSRKRKPFSEQFLNRVVGEQNKNDYTILKKINSDNNRTKCIVVETTAEGNVNRKYHYQHLTENEKSLFQERNTTFSGKATKHRSAENAHAHDGLVYISVADRGNIKDIKVDINAKNADVDGNNNEELALTRSASVLPPREFTPPPEPSNRPDDNFDIQNLHSSTMDDASPAEHNRPSLQSLPSPLLSSPPLSPLLLLSPSKVKLLAKKSKNTSALENSSLKDNDAKAKSTSNNSTSSERAVVTSKPSAVQLVKAELLQEMSSKIDILLINQEKILRKLFPEELTVIRPKNLPPLPLRTHEAFNAFENFLQNDMNFNATVDYFASFSRADTEKSAVGKLLPKIISNTLARIFNWTGSGSIKLGIEGTTLHEALQCAILKNFPKSDLQAATRTMKRWFHTSNQRKVD